MKGCFLYFRDEFSISNHLRSEHWLLDYLMELWVEIDTKDACETGAERRRSG